jgi:hypothetical protein
MDLQLASLISGPVLMWQLLLGGVQFIGYKVGGKTGLAIAAIAVLFWTISNTYNDLKLLQLVVQGGIAYLLFQQKEDEKD